MTRRSLAGAFLALAACGQHPSNADRGVPVELDPRFGDLVDVPFPALGVTTTGVGGKGGVDYVAVWYEAGYDDRLREVDESFHIYRVDPADEWAVDELELPELIDRDFGLWHAFHPDQVLLELPTVLFAYDGEGWIYIDPPGGIGDASYVLVDSDRLYADGSEGLAVWDGGGWRTVPAPEGSWLGPLERDRFRTVRDGPCTIAWDFATLTPQAEVCAQPTGWDVASWSVNGSVDAFATCIAGNRFMPFADGAWSEPSELLPSSGSTMTTTGRPLFAMPQPERDLDELVDGVTGEVMFPATDIGIACGCDRDTDPTCACDSPVIAQDLTILAADTQSLDLLMLVNVNGSTELRARRFDLPVTTAPFSAEDVP